MKEDMVTLAKIASLPKILAAAQTLFELGLQKEPPNETVKRYVQANPDINQYMARTQRPTGER